MVTTVFGARGGVGRHVADGPRTVGEQVRVTSRGPGSAGALTFAQWAADHADEFR
jgi:uncharacterized protein YbjT (DUF2867 family)